MSRTSAVLMDFMHAPTQPHVTVCSYIFLCELLLDERGFDGSIEHVHFGCACREARIQ